MRNGLKPNRRQFLSRAAGVAGASVAFPYIVPPSALGLDGAVAPSNRVTLGVIGVGSMGTGQLSAFLPQPDVQVVAVCDPKRWRREEAQHIVNGQYARQGCAAYVDFRELVARPDIDAVLIASNDHWHVLHALAAVRAGKDLYCQKALGLRLDEIKMLREEVNRYGRVFQFGTQQRSSKEFRFACELVRNGRIGELQTIQVGVNSGAGTGTGPRAVRSLAGVPSTERDVTDERTGLTKIDPEPVPEWLDYEMWLGPAPWKPYSTPRMTAYRWPHISDYCLGYVSGWGIHHIDIAQWGNGTDSTGPVEVSGKAVWPHDDALCDNVTSWDVNYEYANGVKLHFTGSGPGFEGVKFGVTFEGTEGRVYVNRGVLETEPKSLLDAKIGPNELHLPVSEMQERNFIDCVKSRARTISPIDVAVRSDTICQIGWIAYNLPNRKLKWDPDKEVFPDDPDANRLMKRTLRSPWRYEA